MTREEGAKTLRLGTKEIGVIGGKAGPGRGHKTGSVTTRFVDRGANYQLARLDRDRPDIAERVRAGKISAIMGTFRVWPADNVRASMALPSGSRPVGLWSGR